MDAQLRSHRVLVRVACRTAWWLACAAVAAGCMPEVDLAALGAGGGAAGAASHRVDAAPSFDNAELSLLTWNIEWFQDPTRGPDDDARQREVTREVLARGRYDLMGLQEIAVPSALRELVAGALPTHRVLLSEYPWPQQTALVYRASMFRVARVEPVVGLDDAGRPPLEVELSTSDGSALLAIVVHAKAGAEPASRAVRERFAAGLKAHLDARPLGVPVVVLGDFNDRFTGSITRGADSPYAVFASGSGYTAVTQPLETGPEPSTLWGDTVDHVLLSDDLAARVRPESIDVLRDEVLDLEPAFFQRVSDHAPVTLRLGPR
jgi:endonuclease/exonuclease/phosphatase family metal-dependent hydrolase